MSKVNSVGSLLAHPVETKEEKATGSSVGGTVWGSLMNAANKVTDTISSLTTNNSSSHQLTRAVSAPPRDEAISDIQDSDPNRLSTDLTASNPTDDSGDAFRTKAIDTLGQGELSLSELGFESDAGNAHNSSEELLSTADLSRKNSGGEAAVHPDMSSPSLDAVSAPRLHPRRQIDQVVRSKTVPSCGPGITDSDLRAAALDGARSRGLSNLNKDGSSHRDESVASRESCDARPTDDTTRQGYSNSSVGVVDGGRNSPVPQSLGSPDVAEDRENEDALYIHGKDGKKRKVPITGFAVQSGKRNRDFHALFKSVEESDYLIEGTYPC